MKRTKSKWEKKRGDWLNWILWQRSLTRNDNGEVDRSSSFQYIRNLDNIEIRRRCIAAGISEGAAAAASAKLFGFPAVIKKKFNGKWEQLGWVDLEKIAPLKIGK